MYAVTRIRKTSPSSVRKQAPRFIQRLRARSGFLTNLSVASVRVSYEANIVPRLQESQRIDIRHAKLCNGYKHPGEIPCLAEAYARMGPPSREFQELSVHHM